jgi:methionyl-tRNA formyltransferase
MKKQDFRIVFMGTPDFAVASLKALVEGGYNVVGVVTMPDKPVGRHGSVLQPSAVKQYAVSTGLTVLQPEKLKDEGFINDLKALDAHLQIVVAFRMLPEIVWDMPRYGTFNLHGSLLPQYRGAAPINWAIINGEKETGVTTFFLTHEIDTGKIIKQRKISINETDNAGIIHDKLMVLGAELVIETVDELIEQEGRVESISQDSVINAKDDLKPAPKIFKETCEIDWNKTARQVHDFIRGLSPHPAAWTEFKNVDGETVVLKIFESEAVPEKHELKCGTVVTDNKYFLKIAVTDGFIKIKSLQLAGRKRMGVKDFLNGKTLSECQ